MNNNLLLPSIKVKETHHPVTPSAFNVSWQDFGLLSLGALLLLLLVALQEWLSPSILSVLSPIRLLLGLAYILFVPGYCLTTALFPSQDDLDGIERIALSIGLSIAIVPLLALLLDWLPWGIRLWPILLGEYAVMALGMRVALWRRARLPVKVAYAAELSWRPRPWWGSLLLVEKRIYTLLAGTLLLAGLSAAWIMLVPSPDEFMTEFYILGKQGLAEDYPREALLGEELSVTMGIMNQERGEHRYRIEVWVIAPWDSERRQLVSEREPITLPRDHSSEASMTWSMPWAGDDQKVEFLLFMDDNPQPYRQLRLWLNVQKSAN